MELAYQFRIENTIYTLQKSQIPPGSLLEKLLTTKNTVSKVDGIPVINLPVEIWEPIYNILREEEKLNLEHVFETLDYLNIPEFHNYTLACLREEFIRDSMYNTEFQQHPMNTDPYYGLIKVTKALWKDLQITRPVDDQLLFTGRQVQKQDWDSIQESLSSLQYLFQEPGVFVAGGRIFAALFGCPHSDVDLFLYGCTEEEAIQKISNIQKLMEENILPCRTKNSFPVRYMRTKHAVTLYRYKQEFQVILRLYHSPAEIIFGFDVDCCSLGYDGQHIWATPRALWAIQNGCNRVNFGRLSPSYENRLAKYGARGMAVQIPELDKAKINLEEVQKQFYLYRDVDNKWTHIENYQCGVPELADEPADPNPLLLTLPDDPPCKKFETPAPPKARYGFLKKTQGLDLLIYLDYHTQKMQYRPRVLESINNLAKESSDYSPQPFISYTRSGTYFDVILEYYLLRCTPYPAGQSKKMRKYLERIDVNEECFMGLITNSFKNCSKSFFVLSHRELETVLDIPRDAYKALECVRPWDIPRKICFKTTNPGEQMTGTFHRLVLENPETWYNGKYYQS